MIIQCCIVHLDSIPFGYYLESWRGYRLSVKAYVMFYLLISLLFLSPQDTNPGYVTLFPNNIETVGDLEKDNGEANVGNACFLGKVPTVMSGTIKLGTKVLKMGLVDFDMDGKYNGEKDKVFITWQVCDEINIDGLYPNIRFLKNTKGIKMDGIYYAFEKIQEDGSKLQLWEKKSGDDNAYLELFDDVTILSHTAIKAPTNKRPTFLLFLNPVHDKDSLFLKSDKMWIEKIKNQRVNLRVLYYPYATGHKLLRTTKHLNEIMELADDFSFVNQRDYRYLMQTCRFGSGVLFDKNGKLVSHSISTQYVLDYLKTGKNNQPDCFINGNCKSTKCRVK